MRKFQSVLILVPHIKVHTIEETGLATAVIIAGITISRPVGNTSIVRDGGQLIVNWVLS